MASRVGCCSPWDHPSWIRKAGCRRKAHGAVFILGFISAFVNTHWHPRPVSTFLSVQTPRVHTVYPYRFSSAPALVSALIVVMPHLNNIIRVKHPYIFINFPDDQIIPELPWWLSIKESACQCRRHMHCVSRSLIWENSTCHRATKPTRHNYWACALEPMLLNKRSHHNERPV